MQWSTNLDLFGNFNGRLILYRKVFNRAGNIFYDTYYVYDDKGNLRFVLPPEATARITSTATLYTSAGANTNGNPIDQYAYLFQYDGMGRCIAKKNPGADWVYLVYDMDGRLALSQDGNQRAENAWSYWKYDRYDRVIQAGLLYTSAGITLVRNSFASKAFTESFTTSGYTNNNTYGSNMKAYVTYYYDNYNFLNLSKYSAQKATLTYADKAGFDTRFTRVANGVDISTTGTVTGMDVLMLNTTGNLVTALYYDDRGRVIQSLANNCLSGYEKYYYAYNFAGSPLKKQHVHKTSYITEITENYTYEYDNLGRPTNTWHAINSLPPTKVKSLQYNETGQVRKSTLQNDKYSTDYTYNMQGWLKSITSTAFSETLRYQDGRNKQYYNGNISETDESTWSDYYMNTDLHNIYEYDNLNRLSCETSNVFDSPDVFSTVYSYDKNSNISVVKRNGYFGNPYNSPATLFTGYVDELYLEYAGNRLTKTTDYEDKTYPTVSGVDFKDRQGPATEYLYDANGNETGDYNKRISWIKYNTLNLPLKMQMENGNKITYNYDALGRKQKTVSLVALNPMQIPLGATTTENQSNISSMLTRDYCDNCVYLNSKLERIYFPGGYIATNGATDPANWQRIYNLTDHAGNVRVELKSPALTNTTDGLTPYSFAAYYPYGEEKVPDTQFWSPSATSPAHKYNGNEHEKVSAGYLDFNHRWYDQLLGRFLEQDPLASLDYSVSPYAFCAGDPVNYSDPLGLTGTPAVLNKKTGEYESTLEEVIIKPKKNENSNSGGSQNFFLFDSSSIVDAGTGFRDWQDEYERQKAKDAERNKETDYQRIQRQMKEQGIVEGDLTKQLGISAYAAGAVSTLYEKHLASEIKALERAAKGAFANKRAIAKAIGFNKEMAIGAKAVGKGLFGVGLALSVVDVVEHGGSASSVGWATADTVMGAIGVWGGPVGASVSLLYATGRIGYQIYDEYNK